MVERGWQGEEGTGGRVTRVRKGKREERGREGGRRGEATVKEGFKMEEKEGR